MLQKCGVAIGGAIMGVPLQVFKRSNRFRSAVGRNWNPIDRFIYHCLALQLPICFEVRALSGSLVSSAPE
jgi:hypothetical protein